LQDIVQLLPGRGKFPEITCARIIFDGRQYATIPCTQTQWGQAADIIAQGRA